MLAMNGNDRNFIKHRSTNNAIGKDELNRLVKLIVKTIIVREGHLEQLRQIFLTGYRAQCSVAQSDGHFESAVELIDLIRRNTVEVSPSYQIVKFCLKK